MFKKKKLKIFFLTGVLLKYLFSLHFSVLSTCSSMPSHIDVSYDDLFGALQCYAVCEQRLGKWGTVCRERNWDWVRTEKELIEREGMEEVHPSLHVYGTSTGASAPATRCCCSSPPGSSLLLSAKACWVSLCVCDYACMFICVCVSLQWVVALRKGHERCPK